MITFTTNALTLAINKQLYFVGIVVVAPHVNFVTRNPVPMWKEVEHRLLRPLTLIHVIDILGKACEVDDAEIA